MRKLSSPDGNDTLLPLEADKRGLQVVVVGKVCCLFFADLVDSIQKDFIQLGQEIAALEMLSALGGIF